ncbi:hypothetical protein Ciccas_013711 [Cichlidogyrus casuarinus]|uniref:Secreted protein n=1 Tax=Cichlidogyrus casuarinus TaxID=1844966 RepID=A0ABD2PJZ0_9PLAT
MNIHLLLILGSLFLGMAEFQYGKHEESWKKMGQCNGKKQSPIDLHAPLSSETVATPKFTGTLGTQDWTVVANGHSCRCLNDCEFMQSSASNSRR